MEHIEHGSTEVLKVTDSLGIPRNNVHFTDNGDKSPYILAFDIQVFYDDTKSNLDEINKNAPECETILVPSTITYEDNK